MKTRAPLCLLITGLFASATLQGCYTFRTVDLGKRKDVLVVKTEPPNAMIWKGDRKNILGPSPQEVKFEYSEKDTELTPGYWLGQLASIGVGAMGVLFGVQERGAAPIEPELGWIMAGLGGFSSLVHMMLGIVYGGPAGYDNDSRSFIGASHTDQSGVNSRASGGKSGSCRLLPILLWHGFTSRDRQNNSARSGLNVTSCCARAK